MSTISTTPSHRPTCPNHKCPLDGIPFPMPRKGEGICPVSGARFAFEVNAQEASEEMVKDRDGRLVPRPADWKVIGND